MVLARSALLDIGSLDPCSAGTSNAGKIVSSFYTVNCADGFLCASQVMKFGRGHDGKYVPATVSEEDSKEPKLYELGCPVEGVFDAGTGQCLPSSRVGNGADSSDPERCYSMDKYDSGTGAVCENETQCFCVAARTNQGNTGRFFHSDEVLNGIQTTTGEFSTQPKLQCEPCFLNSSKPEICKSCNNCEYTSKHLREQDSTTGIYTERVTLGCYEKPPADSMTGADAKSFAEAPKAYVPEPARKYLQGFEPGKPEDRYLVPHYFWYDPKLQVSGVRATTHLPYEFDIGEPSSRQEWISRYQDVAPRLQQYIDDLANKVIDMSQPDTLGRISCEDTQMSAALEDMHEVRAACRSMQSTAQRLNGHDGKDIDELEWQNEDLVTGLKQNTSVNCLKTAGKTQQECASLNCYTAELAPGDSQKGDYMPAKLNKALEAIEKRIRACRSHRDALLTENKAAKDSAAAQQQYREFQDRLESGDEQGAAKSSSNSAGVAVSLLAPPFPKRLEAASTWLPSDDRRTNSSCKHQIAHGALRDFLCPCR